MIVQCPSCSKRYRVNDANIPASGGKIRCPECSHAFVVYPEPAPEPSEQLEPGEKTSVAQRPNMKELLNTMQSGEEGDEEVAKTEVMSGTELPDFDNLFEGQDIPQDQTTEIDNPLGALRAAMAAKEAREAASVPQEDDLKTEQLSSDIVEKSLGNVRGQADSAPPIDDGDKSATEVTPPSMLDDVPMPEHQQRASVPNTPTPPPNSPGPDSPPSTPGFSQSPSNSPGGPPNNPPPGGPSAGGPGSSPSTRFSSTPAGGQNKPNPGASPSGPGGGPSGPPSGPGPAPSGPGAAPSGPGPAPSGPAAGGTGGADPNHDGPWKLETNFGLTYEFADNESLKNWLSSRDDLDGYKLSTDGDQFFPLGDFPQIQQTSAPGSGGQQQMASTGEQSTLPDSPSQSSPGAAPSGAGSQAGQQPFSTGQNPSLPGGGGAGSVPGRSPSQSGSGPLPPPSSGPGGGGHSPFRTASTPGVNVGPEPPGPGGAPEPGPPSKEKINPGEKFQPPSRDSALLNGVLWGAFVLLGAAAVVLALQLLGVIDLIDEEATEEEAQPVEEFIVDDDEELEVVEGEDDSEARRNREVNRLLESARGDMESNRLASALERIERARAMDPERIQVYEMKAEVHTELGEDEEAEELRERAEELRAEELRAEELRAEEAAAEESDDDDQGEEEEEDDQGEEEEDDQGEEEEEE